MCRFGKLFVGVGLLPLLFLSSLPGLTQTLPPEIVAGSNWLQAQIQPDGTLANEDISIALPLQVRAEVLTTLQTLGVAVPPALLTQVDNAVDPTLTVPLARQAIAHQYTGTSDATAIAGLLALRNSDNGLGATAGFASSSLDTAWFLAALNKRTSYDSNIVGTALALLQQNKLADGGWGVSDGSAIYTTALVGAVATAWSSRFATSPIATASQNWLLSQRNVSLNFGNTFDNACALLTLATQTAQTAVLQPIADALKAAQLPNGSWDNDPYLTALALRALFTVSQPPSSPTTADIQGIVVDAATGNPIAGANVSLKEYPPASADTAANGSFALSGIPAGTYTVRVAALGYTGVESAITVTAGQQINLGTIRLTAAPLTASVSGVVKQINGAPLSGVLIATGLLTATTDDNGTYLISGIAAGSATITAGMYSYQTASATVDFAAGVSYIFSPTMYTVGTTLPATSLKGKVVNSANQALANVTVTLSGQPPQTTAAAGTFQFNNLTAGSIQLTLTANGYLTATVSATLVAGVNDIGAIAMKPAPVNSTLSGIVTDVVSGAPIANALIAVQGQIASTNSAADGSYTLSGIDGIDFSLLVSAAGYLSQTLQAHLAQPGDATLNIQLSPPAPSGITIESVTPNQASYKPNDEVSIAVGILNSSDSPTALLISAQVFDDQHNLVFEIKANSAGGVPDRPNLPLVFPAGTLQNVGLEQLLLRQAGGTYTAHVLAADGSGRVLAERDAQFVVAAMPILAGGVTPNPPLAQIGAQQPIQITADLTNLGNQPIPAGSLDLRITLDNPEQISTTPHTVISSPASGAPLNNPRGLIADEAGNFYTVNYNDGKLLQIAADGTMSVVATLPAPTNPSDLARDHSGNFWVISGNRLYKIAPTGVVTTTTLTTLYSAYGIDVASDNNLLIVGTINIAAAGAENRLIRRDATGVETVLWSGGLANPVSLVKDDSGNYVVTNYGDNTISKVEPDGSVTPFVSGLNRPQGITRDAAVNYYVANSGDGTIVKVTPAGVTSVYATGFNQPLDLKFDGSGNLFVSNSGDDSILKVAPDGTVTVFARGIAKGPEGMKYDAAGNLWIANDDGTLRMMTPQGDATVVTTGLSSPKGLALTATGDVLIANSGGGAVTRVTNGTKSTFATGLSYPWGVAVGGNGDVYVTEYSANRISRFDGNGNPLGVIDSMLYSPSQVRAGSNGEVYVANIGFITIVENGVPRKLISGFSVGYIAPDPVNNGLIATSGANIYRIGMDGTSTKLATVAFSPYGVGVDAAGNILVADYNGKRIVKIDSTGVISPWAALSKNPSTLATDFSGLATVRYSDNTLATIGSDGSESPLALSVSGTASNLSVGADGKLQVAIYDGAYKIYSVDRFSGMTTLLATLTTAPTDLAGDVAGGVYVIYSGAQDFKHYDGSGALLSTLSGFVSPYDIVWDGSVFWFSDSGNRLYTLAPNGYPIKQSDTFYPHWLVVSNGILYGTNSSTIYQWSGNAQQIWSTLGGTGSLTGIASRADGALAVGNSSTNRVLTIDSGKNIVADYAGLNRPMGLAFDAQGRLYVANNGSGTVLRFDGATPTTLANVGAGQYMAFDSGGYLWVSANAYSLYKIAPNGTTTTSNTSSPIGACLGILLDSDSNQWVCADRANSQMLRYDGTSWTLFATGLSNPQGLRVLDNGDLAIISRNNNTIVRYSNGSLSMIANNLAGLHKLGVDSSGKLFASADGGILNRIAADGSATTLDGLMVSVNDRNLDGIVPMADGSLYTVVPSSNFVFHFAVEQAAAPPAAGTVVYQASLPMAELPVADQYDSFDFGSWLPPYGGDFKIEVSRAGVDSIATNFVHVGGSASSSLVALQPELPPGDQTLPMCMKLSGADFTSISRVETGQVRKLTSSNRPNGMAADRAGNLYYTSPTALIRVAPDGTATTITDGLSLAFGLAADSHENLFMASKNATTGNFELIKVDLAGAKTVVVDLGVTQANGVQVDSHDDILVGSPNKLLKVNKTTGAVTVVSASGLPQPRGLAIDSKDNVFVQSDDMGFSGGEGRYVSMIRPDGSAEVIFSKGDGTIDPVFEGDGYPNIAGDCGENFYIAPFVWARINLNFVDEEHTLAQVVPRTGQVSAMLDVRKVSSTLTDIDYISYDPFNNRILMFNEWTDPSIWQAPVTCGAIGVDVHLLAKPGQNLSGASRTPNAVVPHADGRTEYVWSLENVTTDGEQVCFDASQDNLQLGELRKTLDSGFMSFKNSFAPGDITVPFAVPNVQVTNLIGLTIATDAADYPANSTALVTTTLTNTDALRTIGGTLNVQVFDTNAILVGSVTQQGVTLLPGDVLPVTAPFAIGTIVPATYTAQATLTDNGIDLARATTPFNVLPNNESASAVSALAVDRLEYNPSDQVIIASRAQSQSANLILDNLTLMVTVFDAQNNQIFSHGHSIATLLPKALRDFTATETLSNVPAGVYTVDQDLLDGQMRVLDHNTVTYKVGATSASGFGLTGTILANPHSLSIGGTVTLTATATNQGNSDVSGLPLTLYIVDPLLGNVVASFDQTSDIAQGATVPFDQTWVTSGRVGATYLAILTATVSGSIITLAQDSFTLTGQVAAGIIATGGTPQSATVSQSYPVQLEATVRDTATNPIAGVTVTFAAPLSGASVTFPGGNTAVTDAAGRARVTVTANNTAGIFTVNATTPGVTGAAVFNLENKNAIASQIEATGGTPQTAGLGTIFAENLQATVRDTVGTPVASVVVTFSGAGVLFPYGNTAVTNAQGQAEVVAAAGNSEGSYTATATAPGITGTANFYLTVKNQQKDTSDNPIPSLKPSYLWLLMLLLLGIAWRRKRIVAAKNTQTNSGDRS